jgi:outer membrane protein
MDVDNQEINPEIQDKEEIIPIQEKKPFLQSPSLSIILLILIGILYILFFVFSFKPIKKPSIPEAAVYQKKGGLTIAFVDSDTIKAHYQLVNDLQENLDNKYNSLNKDIAARQSALEDKGNELQKKYDARQISMEEAQKMDEMLKMEGKKLYDLNQKYTETMAEEEARLNKIYVDSINNFLERFNNRYNFDYILGYSKGGGILYARDTLDITKYVLEGLNEEYHRKFPDSKKKTK